MHSSNGPTRARRIRLSALGLGLALIACAITPSQAQQPYDLRGVWKLTSITLQGKDVPSNGWMIITKQYYVRVVTEKGRDTLRDVPFRTPEKLTPGQQRRVALTFPRSNDNGGTYYVKDGYWYFRALALNRPDIEGNEFRRRIELSGSKLRLVQETADKADERWERVEEVR